MKLLFVSGEASPFAASGGLGDVMGALPVAIKKCNPSISIDVILPYYNTIKKQYSDKFEKVIDITFNLSWRTSGATVYKYPLDGVNYLFVENHYYFDRSRLYGEFDDGERFAFFSKAVIEYLLQSGEIPDVIHANDWQSALCVIYLKTEYARLSVLSKIKTLYTVHNIEYQGKFGLEIIEDVFGIDRRYKNVLEYDGCINLMKGAITVSDAVSTVSPRYAEELTSDEFAFGLARIIKDSRKKLSGVINGIDYSVFSPEKSDIPQKYSKSSFKTGKETNKKLLQKMLNLEVNTKIPLLSMITRLTHGKGIDLVLDAMESLLSLRVQLIVLGTGDSYYENRLTELSKRYANLSIIITFDRALSKHIYAASDIFLMPSKSEPCGLSQMIAASYGTIPVVRDVGGLADSIIDCKYPNSNGFKFTNFNSQDLLYTINRALTLYDQDEKWNALVLRAMNTDFSWSNSAQKYVAIYNDLLN